VVDAPIRVLLTRSATNFVTPRVIGWIADEVVTPASAVNPVGLANRARLLVVCPATANFVVSAGLGLAATPALTAVLANPRPTLFFPHTNAVMWAAPTTQDAVRKLRERGEVVVTPRPAEVFSMWDRRFIEAQSMPAPDRTAEIVATQWRSPA
jgi:phosphopantothenoylcysteine synthetase/decarboxylase